VNLFDLLTLSLQLVEMVLTKAKSQGAATEVVEALEAGLAKLREVHGTEVTKAQLGTLRG
jgi:hypothetical protein